MSRPKETDYTSTLTMLHTAVMNTGTDLRDTIGKGFEKLEASGQSAQEATRQSLVDELGRMRANLREARDRLTTGEERLNAEVRGAVTALRSEMHEVKEALEALTPPAPPHGTGAFPAAAEQNPATARATAVPGPAPQSATTLTIPAQRDSETPDAHEVPAAASSEAVRLAVREALAEELTPLRSALEERPDTLPASIRDDIRAHMDEALGGLREQADKAGKELHAELTALRNETAALRAMMNQTTAANATVEVSEGHSALLREAARVSSATVLCHRDAWEFITAHAGQQPHFRVPAQVLGKEDERIRAALSGRSLIALLIALHSVKENASEGDGDQELATVLYDRIKESLTGLSAAGRPVTITLDDRVTPDEPDTPKAPTVPDQDAGNEEE